MAFNYNANTKSYSYTPKDNPKDRVEIEVGDAMDSLEIHPQVKIKRWDNEVNSSIRLIHDSINGSVKVTDDGNTITWSKKQGQNEWKCIFYDRPDASNEGGFEFEIHVPAKPPVNYLQFSVNTKELNWFYQPALTQQEIDEGASRPDNVIGSYAVYHKTKGGLNDSAGMDYKVGKAFHVYRPHVVDSGGHETWGVLELDEVNGILKISVDQTWLNNAVYPVVVDPTFGYTSIGGSDAHIGSKDPFTITERIGHTETTSEAGTVDSISAYIGGDGTAAGVKVFINEEDSGGSGTHGEVVEIERTSVDGTGSWEEFTAASESLTASNAYILNLMANITADGVYYYIKYDSSGSRNNYNDYGATYASHESPWTQLAYVDSGRMSIYATYTAGGGGVSVDADVVTGTLSLPTPTVTAVKNVSISADVVTGTLSLPTPTVTAITNISTVADVVTGVLSLPDPTITAIKNVNVSSDVVSLTSSLPGLTVTAVKNVSVNVDVVSLSASLPTPTVSGGASISADVVTVTASLPDVTLSGVLTSFAYGTYYWRVRGIDPTGSEQYGDWATTRSFTISSGNDANVNADVVTGTLSLPAPTVTAVKNVSVASDVITGTLSLPTPTVTVTENISVSADVVTLTSSLPAPTVNTVSNVNVSADVVTLTSSLPEVALSIAGAYFSNAGWGLNINTLALVKTKSSKLPVWSTAGRPTGRSGVSGWNRETNKLEVYDVDSGTWYIIDATQL